MGIKSAQTLVAEASSEVKTINTNQAYNLVKENKCLDCTDVPIIKDVCLEKTT